MPDEPVVESGEFSEDSDSKEESLEDLASEQPEMREADAFSESRFSNIEEMPTPTITSSPQNDFSETQFQESENLEQTASGFTTATTIADPGAQVDYSPQNYQEYFGKSYASGGDYEAAEKQTRDLIRREEFAKGVSLPRTQIVQQRWDNPIQQINAGDWRAEHEKEARDYILEQISKKEKKKQMRD